MGTIDLYCERLGPGLLAEPLNAITKLGVFHRRLASVAAGSSRGKANARCHPLPTLLVAFGVGSSLFHTFASPTTRTLDVLPIALFMFAYLWLYLIA